MTTTDKIFTSGQIFQVSNKSKKTYSTLATFQTSLLFISNRRLNDYKIHLPNNQKLNLDNIIPLTTVSTDPKTGVTSIDTKLSARERRNSFSSSATAVGKTNWLKIPKGVGKEKIFKETQESSSINFIIFLDRHRPSFEVILDALVKNIAVKSFLKIVNCTDHVFLQVDFP